MEVMEITYKRVGEVMVQVINQDGENFFSLADIMDITGTKPSFKNGIDKSPISISGRIAWGFRMVGTNYIESIFVDYQCMMDIFAEHPVKAFQKRN